MGGSIFLQFIDLLKTLVDKTLIGKTNPFMIVTAFMDEHAIDVLDGQSLQHIDHQTYLSMSAKRPMYDVVLIVDEYDPTTLTDYERLGLDSLRRSAKMTLTLNPPKTPSAAVS